MDWADQVQRDTDQAITDVLHGVNAEYGEYCWTTPAATTPASAGVWLKALGTTELTSAAEFTMPVNNRLLHGDQQTEEYLILFDFTITSGSNNQVVWVGISKNGDSPTIASQRYRKITTGTDAGMGSTHGLFELALDDFVEGWVMNETSTGTITIERAAVTAFKVV
jgi:hypothetical protein